MNATSNTPRSDSYWTIPSCAWTRTMGNVPRQAVSKGRHGPFNTATRTKKGVSLGGIGAGSFMYNYCGSFGPWHMKPGRYEERFLEQAAFHVREHVLDGHSKPQARTLATDDVLPAWPRLQPGEAEYAALFPQGWCTYNAGFASQISLHFFSPIIKENYRETSLPVGLFLFKAANPLDVAIDISLMFTFPNAPYTGPHNLHFIEDFGQSLEVDLGEDDALQLHVSKEMRALQSERTGLTNHVSQEDGVTAIIMRANSPHNSPETENSEWCIATTGNASFFTSWDGDSDGSAVWEDFVADGVLSSTSTNASYTQPAGALAIRVKLEPGQEAVLPFALSWHFPQVEFGSGTRWWRRYTEYLEPGVASPAASIARQALQHYDEWHKELDTWTQPIIEHPGCPDWLKQAALNELYYFNFGASFWENGCINKSKKFGARPGQHLAFLMECQEYRFAETFDVRHHVARTSRELWPQMERDILLAYADFILDTPDGSAPHDAGGPNKDPYNSYDDYFYIQLAGQNSQRKTTPWSEFSPKFIQQVHAYWKYAHDDNFLSEAWPALVRTYRYQQTTDTDGDGLTEMKSSEYRDNKLFNAVLWIGALEAMLEMAQTLHAQDIQSEVEVLLKKARTSTETQFWNEKAGYYQFNARSNALMADAFIGQRYVDITGLEPVLNPQRITSHYHQIFKRLVAPLADTNGDGIGDIGAANLLRENGEPAVGDSEFVHEHEVWVGVSYALAANLYHWGKQNNDQELMLEALNLGKGLWRQTWENEVTAYWFATPEAWTITDPTAYRAIFYQRARAVWELLMEVLTQ